MLASSGASRPTRRRGALPSFPIALSLIALFNFDKVVTQPAAPSTIVGLDLDSPQEATVIAHKEGFEMAGPKRRKHAPVLDLSGPSSSALANGLAAVLRAGQ